MRPFWPPTKTTSLQEMTVMKPERIFARCLAILTLLFLPLAISAQTTTSTIEGTVKDSNGALVAGAQVKASSSTLAVERTAVTDAEGFYRIVALPAGNYTVAVTQSGFASQSSTVELTLNRTQKLDFNLQVGQVGTAQVTVTDVAPLIEPTASATGATVTPKQIAELPVNGRNYLDLLQLVPGTAINRQANPDSDNANPILGERGGNNNFLIDGHPNKDSVTGGPAAQFNQETIGEFQVLTTGYKAEFGQASGAIVNVITKSGGNQFHGAGSYFHRNDAFDSSNSLDPTKTDPPALTRHDGSFAIGGPIIKNKMFFFGSAERISEDRVIDFSYPNLQNAVVNQQLQNLESSFDDPTKNRETRLFLKLNEQFGIHSLSQEANYTNGNTTNFAPLSAGNSLPSTRSNLGSRNLLLAFGDTMLLGDAGDPWIVTLRGTYRDEPSDIRPAHPETNGGSTIVLYTVPALFVPGDLPTFNVGNNNTRSFLDQKYTGLTAHAAKRFGDHEFKFGWNFLRTKVDGAESRFIRNQLYATLADFQAFAPIYAGIQLPAELGGATPADDEIHLRNTYNAVFVQDDWRLRKNLTLNLGLRWERDSEFEANRNFSPRLGVAWAINPKTVIRGQLGVFYDQFRLGTARRVPPFGGANQTQGQVVLYPRGLYGSPSYVSSIALLALGSGPCFSNQFVGNLTDAQITNGNLRCTFPGRTALPMVGVDRLNNVVAPGHAPIPANSIITVDTIQSLTGLTPDQYLTQANAAIGFPGFFTWGPSGLLTNRVIPATGAPNTLQDIDQTPHTLGFSVGFQREIGTDMVVEADYHHREIRDMLGQHLSNLAFRSRVSGRSFDPPNSPATTSFGPYYKGVYDAIVIAFNKRFSNRYQFGASYAYSKATDNNLGINTNPSDNFIGVAPVVTEAPTATCAGGTNANGPYTACNGRFVAAAGTFVNGPDLDKGPSDLSLDHVFQANGLVALPWGFQISGIFRAQSGFHYSKLSAVFIDPDGDGSTNSIDTSLGRNGFTAPPFVNLDLRFGKQFKFRERYQFDIFYEMFNVFNRQNPASINAQPAANLFGTVQQVLPGREGQIGLRFSF
jgi:hypothetical protein